MWRATAARFFFLFKKQIFFLHKKIILTDLFFPRHLTFCLIILKKIFSYLINLISAILLLLLYFIISVVLSRRVLSFYSIWLCNLIVYFFFFYRSTPAYLREVGPAKPKPDHFGLVERRVQTSFLVASFVDCSQQV